MLLCIGITILVLALIYEVLVFFNIPAGVMLFFVFAAIVVDILIMHKMPDSNEGSGMLDVITGSNRSVGRWKDEDDKR